MVQPLPYDLKLIKKILPHRHPFLFVDRVLAFEAGVRITAAKKLDPEAAFFAGHFPGRPIMPGVLVAEALAQACGLLLGLTFTERTDLRLFLARVDLKFSRPAQPHDTLVLEALLKKTYGTMHLLDVAARVGSRLIAKGSLALAEETR
jgi:3-hydroxyacyl-[acyl-carrier-protein] dehydratase